MVSFRVEKTIRAPPEFVRDWWLDFSPSDAALAPDTSDRSVERLDERRVRVTTESRTGSRPTLTDGVVTRTGVLAWVMKATVYRDGIVVADMSTAFSVAPVPDGSELGAQFELHGRTTMWRLSLWLARAFLRRDRNRVFDSYVSALERDYRARGRPPAVPSRESFPTAASR
jgi:hypothetical protein